MKLPLDHVVVAVADLDRAVARCTQAGFTVLEGGRHPGRPTRNALVVFRDGSYVELITYDAPAPNERWWRVFSEHGEGLVDFALVPPDLDAVVDDARSRGYAELELRDGARARPDGVSIAWRSARPPGSDVPFLCADVTPRSLRVPEGAVREHANGVIGIAELQVAVRDLAATQARYRAYLGPDVVDGASIRLEGFTIQLVEDSKRVRPEGPSALRLRSREPQQRIELLDVPLLR